MDSVPGRADTLSATKHSTRNTVPCVVADRERLCPGTFRPEHVCAIFNCAGFRGRDAHRFIQLVEEMASANLIHRFESKLEAQGAALSAQLRTQRAELGEQLGTQRAELGEQLGTQRAELGEKLGVHKAEMVSELGALKGQLRFIRWGIGILLSVIAAAGATVGILSALPN